MEAIAKSNLGLHVKSIIGSEDDVAFNKVTATLGLLLHVASADREFELQEISYIKHYLAKKFDLNSAQYNDLVNGAHFIFTKEKPDSKTIKAFRSYLNDVLNEKEKSNFVNTLLSLSCADRDLEKIEKSFVKNIASALGLDRKDVKEDILTHGLDLIQKIDKEIAMDASLQTSVEELNKIEFVTVAEFIEDLQARGKR